MKAGLISLAALSAVAVAQPYNNHRHQHVKKQVVEYDVVTQTAYATATAAGAVVYVDANGNAVSTSLPNQAAATNAPAPPAYNPPAPAPPAPIVSSQAPPPPPAYTAPATSNQAPPPPAYTPPAPSPPAYSPPASSSSSSAPAQTSSSSSDSGSEGYGITYSPYKSNNDCKSQDEVNKDFESINGYGWVRTYGTDCDQANTVVSAASAKGMKVFAGIYDVANLTAVEASVNLIHDAVKGDWSKIHTISVGNEGINAGTYTVTDVQQAVDHARSKLQEVNYSGKVVTVDTFVAIIANPDLCRVGDYVAANCHAFFDGDVTADNAGEYVVSQAQRVSDACGGKDTMITESGWPSSGSNNKLAVPSTENQKAAIDSLKASFSSNIIMFTAFNDYWKTNNGGTFGAEQYWGIYGNCPSES